MMKLAAVSALVFFAALATAQQQCGQTPIAPNLGSKFGDSEIVGGADAKPYSWPWQIVWCSVGWFGGCSLECGGSVVDNGWVITAGHCVDGYQNKPNDFKIKAGVFKEKDTDEAGEAFVKVKAIHLHPKYQSNPDPKWDIALIELASPITYSSHIQPVCLPSADANVIVDPNFAWVTGWGTTSEGGSISENLKQVKVPFVNTTDCQKDYPGDIDPQVHICAGKGRVDTCQGDSGGPLVVQNAKGAWYMYGLTSFGQGCAESGHPGVYSRVSTYCDWIKQTTSSKVQCSDPSA